MTIKRVLAWFAVVACTVVLLIAGALFWGSRSETVLRWGVERFVQRLPCTLAIEGLRGSLLEPLNIAHIVCENTQYRIEAHDVAFAWSPWELQQRRLAVTLLSARDVHALLKESGGASSAIPTDLRLPIDITVAQAQIQTLIVERGNTRFKLDKLDTSYRSDQVAHYLAVERVESEWGILDGEVTIGAIAPLRVNASVNIAGEHVAPFPYTIAANISGELRELTAQINASVKRHPFTARVNVAPFSDPLVYSVSAQTSQLDLATFDSRTPSTALQIDLLAQSNHTSGISGSIEVRNDRMGRLDQNLLPLATLASRFSANSESIRLEQMRIDLAAAGRAHGSATLERNHMTLSLDVDDLDLRGLHGKLRPTALVGSVSAVEIEHRRMIQVDLREREPTRIGTDRGGIALTGKAEILPDRINIEHLGVVAGGASASTRGNISLDKAGSFDLTGSLSSFDPARFGEFPQAHINASIDAKGIVRPDWRAAVRYQLAKSTFIGSPLTSKGQFEISATRIRNTEIVAELGGNRVNTKGSLGAPGDQLSFAVNAGNLKRIDQRVTGSLTASGTISGSVARPEIKASLDVQALGVENIRIGHGQANVALSAADDPEVRIGATLESISRADTAIDAVRLDVAGTLSQHDATITASAPLLQLRSNLKGGWDRTRGKWTGVVSSLENKGEYAFAMLQQTSLEIGINQLRLGASRVRFSNTDLNLGETQYANDTLITSGSVSGVRASRLLGLLKEPPAIESTLELGARWEVRAGSKIDGMLEITRSAGDIVIPGEESLTLGLTDLRLRIEAKSSQILADALIRGNAITARANAQSRLERRGSRWGFPGNAPLKLDAVADLQSLRPLAAAASRSVTADGKLRFTVKADGTVAAPRLTGGLEASDLKVENVANGVFLGNGHVKAEFRDDVLTVSNFVIHGGTGTLSAQGTLASKGRTPLLDLEWSADRLDIVQHPFLQLRISGKGKLANRQQRFSLTGVIKADRGRIQLRSGTAPTLGDDVVIIGNENRSQLVAETRRADLDVELDLGPDFTIAGRGLDARLAGKIKLTSSSQKPLAANGEIKVASGTYEAYKTQLQIDAGVLNFAGAIDNPGLSILALRKKQQVEAGVEITGTARDPRIRLFSNPDVPDPEKLSWLVLGRKIESGNSSDAQRLQGAATAMAAGLGSLPLQKQLASAVGLDELGFRPGDAEQGGVFAVGKRISDKIYVSHEHSLSTATNTLRVSYQFSKRLSLRTESGVTDAVDLFFTVSFD